MKKKHPAESKTMVHPAGLHGELDRKKMELGDAMEHEQGENREDIEEDIEELDAAKGG